jgi:hypothetical protein
MAGLLIGITVVTLALIVVVSMKRVGSPARGDHAAGDSAGSWWDDDGGADGGGGDGGDAGGE